MWSRLEYWIWGSIASVPQVTIYIAAEVKRN